MRRAPIVLLLAGLAIVAGPRGSFAQDPVVAHVPFAFMVDGRVMPAGDYRVTRDNNLGDHVLTIVNRDGRAEALAVFEDAGPASNDAAASFQFKTIGEVHYLWRVTEPGAAYQLHLSPRVAADAKLAKAGQDRNRKGNN